MGTTQLHRGRLIDHIQLVVRDLALSRKFYTAVLNVLEIPVIDTADGYFWADELVVSSPESAESRGVLTGYYAAFVLDPDGNNIEAVHHGEARRSAPSVAIDF